MTIQKFFHTSILFFVLVRSCLGLAPNSIFLLSTAARASTSSSCVKDNQTKPKRLSWLERVNQLIEYREKHGDTLVPKRYVETPGLGNWVNKQRQQYRVYCGETNGKSCSMTEDKIRVLNQIGFCWSGTVTEHSQKGINWWSRFEDLKVIGSVEGDLPLPLANWLRKQRKEYDAYVRGNGSSLDEKKIAAMNSIDPDWYKTIRQKNWEARCQELIEYKEIYGDTCVPITFENKKLANWVSNLRKSYNLKMAGKPSSLTDDQIQYLESLDFIWSRWDYEYEKIFGDRLD